MNRNERSAAEDARLFPVIGSGEARRYIAAGRSAPNALREQIATARRQGRLDGAVMLATIRGAVEVEEFMQGTPASNFTVAGSGAGAGRAAAIAEAGSGESLSAGATSAEVEAGPRAEAQASARCPVGRSAA